MTEERHTFKVWNGEYVIVGWKKAIRES